MADDAEQQLREKIATQKAAVDNLPPLKHLVLVSSLNSVSVKASAQLIKELSDNEEKLELLLESKRVADVVRLQDERHPPKYSEGCPICLETIKYLNIGTIVRFNCCGGLTCVQCNEKRKSNVRDGVDEMYQGKCPLCRERIPGTTEHEEIGKNILKHANEGRAWAQMKIGMWYSDEMFGKKYGFRFDKEKAVQFLKQAADQGDSDAVMGLAFARKKALLDWDESKYMHYLKMGADLGNPDAQKELSRRDKEKFVHYTTLAVSQGDTEACAMLGYHFMARKSFILAKYYTEKYIENAEKVDPFHAFSYAMALFYLEAEQYGGIEVPGYSSLPKTLFWLRKALEGNSPRKADAMEFISDVERLGKKRCSNCLRKVGSSPFMRCSRCLGAWYCGKECQVQHWKAGHKIDCIKKKSK